MCKYTGLIVKFIRFLPKLANFTQMPPSTQNILANTDFHLVHLQEGRLSSLLSGILNRRQAQAGIGKQSRSLQKSQWNCCQWATSNSSNQVCRGRANLSAVEWLHFGNFYINSIDLFTNVSQIYGCFFPRDLVTSHFINLYLMIFQSLQSTLLILDVAMSDKPWTSFQVVRNNLC